MKYRLAHYIFVVKVILLSKITTILAIICAVYWGVIVEKNVTFKGIPRFRNLGKIRIGNGTRVVSGNINLVGDYVKTAFQTGINGTITIGSNCGLSNCVLISQSEIKIEDEVYIGGGTRIYDNDFHSSNPIDRLNKPYLIPSKPVRIARRAFIGGHTIILKGVEVGENAVVGAGSLVTKSIPNNEVWAGVPAKKVGEVI